MPNLSVYLQSVSIGVVYLALAGSAVFVVITLQRRLLAQNDARYTSTTIRNRRLTRKLLQAKKNQKQAGADTSAVKTINPEHHCQGSGRQLH